MGKKNSMMWEREAKTIGFMISEQEGGDWRWEKDSNGFYTHLCKVVNKIRRRRNVSAAM